MPKDIYNDKSDGEPILLLLGNGFWLIEEDNVGFFGYACQGPRRRLVLGWIGFKMSHYDRR